MFKISHDMEKGANYVCDLYVDQIYSSLQILVNFQPVCWVAHEFWVISHEIAAAFLYLAGYSV